MSGKLPNLLAPVLTAVVAAGAAAGIVAFVMSRDSGNSAQSQSGQNPLVVGYATQGVTAVGSQEDFDKAVAEAVARSQEPGVSVKFKSEAFSDDGANFSCYLGNDEANGMDMFIAIYTDNTFEDELFVSGLLRPGEAFERITLNRALSPGTHSVVAAFSLVTEENGQQSIAKQTFVSLRFNVS